jgi:hypothetical protein
MGLLQDYKQIHDMIKSYPERDEHYLAMLAEREMIRTDLLSLLSISERKKDTELVEQIQELLKL